MVEMPFLEKLDEHYSCGCEDSCTLTLKLIEDKKMRVWELDGGEGLLEEHPELEPFFRFWRSISRAIESRLALSGRLLV